MTKILIVDDHEPSLLITEALMKNRGYEVLKAFNGAEALEIARQDLPDIIVSDILMPVMDGFTLCREIKKDPRLFNIPFIFTSAAFVSEEDEKLCLELGGETLLIRSQEADGFVQELQSIVSECLDSRHTVGRQIHLDENFQKKYREALLRKLTDKITELEHTNMELTRSEARYRLLADNIADVIWTMDNNLNTTYVSPSVRQLSGYTPDDVLSQSIEERFTEESMPEFKKALDAVNLNGGPVILEVEQPCKNDTTKWIEICIQLLQDDKNNQIGYLGCSRDITLRKKDQFEKEELEAKLRQAQKMEAIGTLAGGIAHDFNNILQSILWNIEILKMDLPHPNPLHENIEQALKAGFRAKDLINQILTISRQSDHEYIPIQPHIILKDSLKLLRASLPTTIEIIDNIDNKCGFILGDLTNLHQIIINLCTNAQHAMRETGGKIKISLKQMEVTDQDSKIKGMIPRPGKYIRLEVSDTGCGMDKQTLLKIFDPYFTTKKLGEGTGLGLSVVHGIIKKLGGEIVVFSELSVGTTFHVYFPLYSNDDISGNKIFHESVPNGSEGSQ